MLKSLQLSNNKKIALPAVMGIINLTPDSFSDGGRYKHIDDVKHMVFDYQEKGAQIIDIGAESSRPGAQYISVDEELDRLSPILETIRKEYDGIISIDSYKPQVMEEAAKLGIEIINDIRALQEPGAVQVAVKYNMHVCLMHMQNRPETMQQNPSYQDVNSEIHDFLSRQIKTAINNGLPKEHIIIDPGIGFGKNPEHNLQIIQELKKLKNLNCPICIGISRKSITKHMFENGSESTSQDRLLAANILSAVCFQNGAGIFRTHDVKSTKRMLEICITLCPI